MKPGDLSSLADLPGRLEKLGDRPAAVFRGRYRSRTLTYRLQPEGSPTPKRYLRGVQWMLAAVRDLTGGAPSA